MPALSDAVLLGLSPVPPHLNLGVFVLTTGAGISISPFLMLDSAFATDFIASWLS